MRVLIILTFVIEALAFRHAEQQVLSGGGSSPKRYSIQTPPLDTDWTYEVGTNPWPQHPRPKLVRPEWQNLNGLWTYANAKDHKALKHPPFNKTLSHEVLVPFCLESGLSGIQADKALYSWYRTTFTVPKNWTGDRVLLNFQAVDYEATVFVNGQNVSFHRGGFTAFTVDVTKHLNNHHNELIVFVFDPTDSDGYVIPVGKQALDPSHIRYRACSGIWQTVWIESVPKNYIEELSINGDAGGQLNLTVVASNGKNDSRVDIAGSDRTVATYGGFAGSPISFNVQSPKTWSTDVPDLYDVTVSMDEDTIRTYTGFRTVSRAVVHGVQRISLNGEVIFPFGTLDQGYWPDGLYTPPTYDAMVFDIITLKRLGYNMLRKHVKVESPLYYAAADELGILIMQDIPSLATQRWPDKKQHKEFVRQLEEIVTQFRSYTSIFSWVIYNEGWGQVEPDHAEYALTRLVRTLDPTRLINSVSGWFDHGAGDFSDNHHYTNPQCGTPWHESNTAAFDPSRIGFQGEFGGTGHNVSGKHLWKVQKAVDTVNETYELWETLDQWNFRGHFLLSELLEQVQLYSCAGAVWTETTDVEGEINGMMTYDRRLLRPDVRKWRGDIQALYDASAYRSKGSKQAVPQDVHFEL
ncbi:putative beta-galactosidase [Tothia fuscella]|uniref:Beta-galactosidase n=1 Tax=Tothia fuscella TaxID=1048955 RepID=A0A9P4NSD4_9PEZI|nr:putative beta-galactosidase [Tothia fuscella]